MVEPILTSTLKQNLIEKQHSFIKNKSIETNLILFYQYLIDNVSKGFQVDAIYTDIRKVFDTVDHKLLINKLSSISISGKIVKLITSYLTNRTQLVKICNELSDPISVSSGLPQGHLSPVIFIIFINDLVTIFKHSKFLMFADDLKLFKVIKSMDDCYKLQKDLDKFMKWCGENGLKVNASKCKQISFYHTRNP